MSLEIKIKRGEVSWAYFPLAYGILLTISLSIISALELRVVFKIVLIVIDSLVLFKLCFYNTWFRNKIVGVFSRSKEFEEVSKH